MVIRNGYGYGYGDGYGYGYGSGSGDGSGSGSGDGSGSGSGDGNGDGDGDGDGYGYGDGSGSGSGSGDGNGYGDGYPVIITSNGYIQVGCQTHPIQEWRKTWKDLAQENGIPGDQAAEMLQLAEAYVKSHEERKRSRPTP